VLSERGLGTPYAAPAGRRGGFIFGRGDPGVSVSSAKPPG
jgi:hypothetical protein